MQQGGQNDLLGGMLRTEGFIPANASNTGVAGTSSLAGFINMGNEIVGGLIDTGAKLAKMGASAALTAGTMGAGAAAAPAAGMGIDMLASTAERGVQYGFQMAAIWSDALVEQFFPFGAPRWIGYDYTQFVPQLGIQQAITTTAEKALGASIQSGIQGAMGGTGVDPNTAQHGMGMGAPPGPGDLPGGPVQPGQLPGVQQPLPPPPTDPFGTHGAGGAPAPMAAPPAGQPAPQDDLLSRMFGGVFDDGGWMKPGTFGINLSNRPSRYSPPRSGSPSAGWPRWAIPAPGRPMTTASASTT
jgi:hypothetical protein